MEATRIFVLIIAMEQAAAANELIAASFENWDLGIDNSHIIELLIVCIVGIIFLTIVLFLVLICFRLVLGGAYKNVKYEEPGWGPAEVVVEDEETKRQRMLQKVIAQTELMRLQGLSASTENLLAETIKSIS